MCYKNKERLDFNSDKSKNLCTSVLFNKQLLRGFRNKANHCSFLCRYIWHIAKKLKILCSPVTSVNVLLLILFIIYVSFGFIFLSCFLFF